MHAAAAAAEAAAEAAAAPAAPAWISMPDQANSCLIAQILKPDQAHQAFLYPIRQGSQLSGHRACATRSSSTLNVSRTR